MISASCPIGFKLTSILSPTTDGKPILNEVFLGYHYCRKYGFVRLTHLFFEIDLKKFGIKICPSGVSKKYAVMILPLAGFMTPDGAAIGFLKPYASEL